MDNLLKEYCDIAKKIAIEEGRAEGRAEGEAKANFKALKNIMQSFNVSIDKAMDALHTPEAERQYYKDLLAKGM